MGSWLNITSCEEKAFYLVHTRKQLISRVYVNALKSLKASFAMEFFLEGGMAFGSGAKLVVAKGKDPGNEVEL